MTLLIFGVALFAAVHFAKTIFSGARAGLAASIGDGPVKGIVALVLIASIYLMSLGYGDSDATSLWVLPVWAHHSIALLMLPAFVLFFGTAPGSKLRSVMRHPQLTGFKVWAVLHLLANGDVRSVILFGGLLVWAVVQLILINKRDGKPPLPAASANPLIAWSGVIVGTVVWVLFLFWAHTWLFGVAPIG